MINLYVPARLRFQFTGKGFETNLKTARALAEKAAFRQVSNPFLQFIIAINSNNPVI